MGEQIPTLSPEESTESAIAVARSRFPAGTSITTNPIVELYQVYRSYVVHEDNLIGHRLERWLSVQAFLFAASAAVLNKLTDSFPKLVKPYTVASTQDQILRYVTVPTPATVQFSLAVFIQLMFLLSSLVFLAYAGVRTASIVLNALASAEQAHKNLGEHFSANFKQAAFELHLPALHGGGELEGPAAKSYATELPTFFRRIWIGFAVLVLSTMVGMIVYAVCCVHF